MSHSKLMAKDLLAGQPVRADFLITDVRLGTTKKGTQAFWCTLKDRSGSIPAVMWDAGPGVQIPTSHTVAHVVGSSSEYQGKVQVKVEAFLPRTSDTNEDFEKTTTFSVDEMWVKVCDYIAAMDSQLIRTVAQDLMLEQGFSQGFKSSPAASYMHHAFVGGLLEHTSQMCEMAEKLFSLPFIASGLNKDLCMFGILFHDFGKMFEYQQTAGFKKTVQGILVPHIPYTAALVFETCNKFGVPEIVRDHMMHVVLAHHGKVAYGSPVEMAIPEAAFVHYVDNLHGDVFGWKQKTEGLAEESVRHMERTLLVRPFNDIIGEIEADGGT